MSGASAGGNLVRSGGSLVFVRKDVTAADGTYPCEWTGHGASANWTVAANWYDEEGPKAASICAFGAEDTVTSSRFDKCVDNGSTVVRLLFRDTATSHERVFLVEIMGRDAGFLTLNAAIAVGAEVAIIPERTAVAEQIEEAIGQGKRKSKNSSIVLVQEHAVEGGAQTQPAIGMENETELHITTKCVTA